MAALRDKDVLIIEDSPAVGMLLKEFLTSLDFKDIHTCQNGATGIQVFKELIESGDTPIVFLDYNLPDMNALSVITQIFSMKPNTKVIIETARERTEDVIKDVIAKGAYQYLGKPIRLQELKDVIQLIEIEETLVQAEESILEKIEFLVDNSTRISITRLSQYLKIPTDVIVPVIQKLISDKKIEQIEEIHEPACNNCGSVKTTPIYFCPSCHSSSFKQEKLFEHYDCGNVSPATTYGDDLCPKCRKEIKVLGVDYKILDNFFTCNNCHEKFGELSSQILCLKCNNKFNIEKSKWETSSGYKKLN